MPVSVTPQQDDRHPRASRVQSVDRAVLLLQALAAASGPDRTAASLAQACQLNRATAWRILSTLQTHGMVAYDRTSGRWSVGAALAEIGRSVGLDELVAAAHPVLLQLSAVAGETADLAVLRGGGLTYVDEVRPASIVVACWLGRTVPLHATSTGKALLASLGSAARLRLLPTELTAHTPTTITDHAALATELALTRERGWATCRGELESHLHGVSAAVLDDSGHALAVVSIWGPDQRVDADRLPTLGRLAVDAATEIGRTQANRVP